MSMPASYYRAQASMNAEREAQQEAQQRAQREQQAAAEQERLEAERRELERMRQDRLQRELIDSLTDDERKRYAEITDPARLAQSALDAAIEEFNRKNEAQRQREMKEWRDQTTYGNNTTVSRSRALQEINARAEERAQAFRQEMKDRELQAERYSDPVYRVVHALPESAQKIMNEMLDKRPSVVEVIGQIRSENQQQAHAQRQAELRAAYEAEVIKARGNITWATNIRAKYREMGLDI